MLRLTRARVGEITAARAGIIEFVADISGCSEAAVAYTDFTGPIEPGDEVLLNTTAVELRLGTGGVHFTVCNLTRRWVGYVAPGHIMKLRYTPLQKAVLSVEEDDSPYRELIQNCESLDGLPVVCCELHSQIAPVAAAVKAVTNNGARVAYVMTDGGALPIAFSRLVAELKQKAILDVTITCGQAFGGDIEAVSLYSALLAAKSVGKADVAIVCQGPGNAGTGSKFGFSGIQQGEAINASNVLGGRPIAVLRISFADARERHRGVSHHSITVLGDVALSPAFVAVPELQKEQAELVESAIAEVLARHGHKACYVDGEPGLVELSKRDVHVTTMGRSVDEDRGFFLAASAGGVLAACMKIGSFE